MGKSMHVTRLIDLLVRGATALLVVFGLAVVGIKPSLAAIDLNQQRQFDIAPQQLSSALLKFSAQSDIQVTVPGQIAEGKQSQGVVGRLNAGSALAILLKDTALHYDVVDGSTVVIAGASDRKAVRNDFQKVSNPVLTADAAPAPAPPASAKEIRLAQATGTTAQAAAAPNAGLANPTPLSDITEIVVTGTSIKGLDAVGALPVTVMKSEDIARTGATSAEDLFRYISSASSSGSTVQSQATGFQTGSISTISLRGLGSARTLILINGRRSAP